MGCRILLTGFRNSSAEQLLSAAHGYDTLLLPNDKQQDGELLANQFLNTQYDLVLCIGQRPNIKDKIHIETTAREQDIEIQTTVDCRKMVQVFGACGIPAKLSHNAGTSFCNALYFKGLRFAEEYNLDTCVVFMHIPFLKNMASPDLFQKRFFAAVDELKMKGAEYLWIR